MNSDDVIRIERGLAVELPQDLREFLLAERDEMDPDEVEVADDAEAIISMTGDYRKGFPRLTPWPQTWVYLGDEGDACPYYVDCSTGAVVRLHKGDLRQPPLESFDSFTAFRDHVRADAARDLEAASHPLTWKDTLLFYAPVAIALFLMLVIVPLLLFGLSSLFKWLFR